MKPTSWKDAFNEVLSQHRQQYYSEPYGFLVPPRVAFYVASEIYEDTKDQFPYASDKEAIIDAILEKMENGTATVLGKVLMIGPDDMKAIISAVGEPKE